MISDRIPLLFNQFLHQGTFYDHHPYGSGHIHETWLVRTQENSMPDYLLQRINQAVFSNIRTLMENIQLVTTHLHDKKRHSTGITNRRKPLVLIKTLHNSPFYKDQKNDCWRLFEFIPETASLEKPVNSEQAFEAGAIIADFHLQLTDLKNALHTTIPRFHDLDFRLDQFNEACRLNRMNRFTEVKEDAEKINTFLLCLESIRKAFLGLYLPLRVTHNDTKFNNILFDREHHAVSLIDLDTVMPGYIHFDYGDAIRVLANTALEDESDPGNVSFHFPFFEAFTRGYLQTAGEFISHEERLWLHLAPAYMTFIIGLRFLTDHINGDRYFRISREGHNLDRARVQFAFLQELLNHKEKITGILS